MIGELWDRDCEWLQGEAGQHQLEHERSGSSPVERGVEQRMVETVTRTAPDFDLKLRQACEGIAACRKGKI